MSGRVATIYATALFELAAETLSVPVVGAELATVAEGLAGDPWVAQYMGSRYVARSTKRAILDSVLAGAVDERLHALVLLLASRGRLRHIREIAREYRHLEETARGIQHALVSSAVELGAAARERIRRSLEARLGRTVVLATEVDPSLVAGIRVQSEGMEYELSVDGVLRGLASRLLARRGSGI